MNSSYVKKDGVNMVKNLVDFPLKSTMFSAILFPPSSISEPHHHLPALISSYLAGENKSTKNFLPPKTQPFNSIMLIVRPNDGNDLIWRISTEMTAKISWGLVTPC
jgi:hypothetical protein